MQYDKAVFTAPSRLLSPSALLVLLRKCPLCITAWLKIATGVSSTALDVAWRHGSVMALLLWSRP
jgi:hypothetical protein